MFKERWYGSVRMAECVIGTECVIGEEQCGFKQGKGCMNACHNAGVCEEYLASGKYIFWAYMD